MEILMKTKTQGILAALTYLIEKQGLRPSEVVAVIKQTEKEL